MVAILFASAAACSVDGALASTMSSLPRACARPDLFLAIGVISAPEYVHRRFVARSTWMTLLQQADAAAPAICAQFVVRARNAPANIRTQLTLERRAHDDVLEVDVQWDETRMRGPVLTLAAWARHAAAHLPHAKFIAKVDDDSYLHAPGLARALRRQVDLAGLPHPMAYLGTMTWYSWFAKQWDRCGFGWTWRGSDAVGKLCRNSSWAGARCNAATTGGCGEAVGPFPFAAGYLILLSQPLVKAVAASASLDQEVERLSLAKALWTHKGFRHTQIFEDVWLGSFVHRYIAGTNPIAYVQLFRSEIVVDLDNFHWQSTALVHVAQLNEDGTLMVPPGSKVVLEIGANTRNTLDRELLPQDSSAFLVSFEPLLDKYASLLARNSRVDTLTPLGHHHSRGVVLPFAVASEANALRELKISGSTDGCASLLPPVSSYYSPHCTNLTGIMERRMVPTVSLSQVLSSWLKGHDVQLAKIDAQGLDVGVVRSAGMEYWPRLKAVQMEVVRDRPPLKCEPQYAAEPGRASEAKCNALVSAMATMGYKPYGTNCDVHKFKEAGGCEAEMTFIREGFDEPFVRRYCMAQKPHSCGPGAWSLPNQRQSWTAEMHAWAKEEAKGWPAVAELQLAAATAHPRGARRQQHGRG